MYPVTNDNDTGTEGREGSSIIKKQIQPAADTAEFDFLEIIAEMEEKEMDELPPLYTELDDFITRLFQNPPSPESQVALSFSYAGYRVTITQQGKIELIPVKYSLGENE